MTQQPESRNQLTVELLRQALEIAKQPPTEPLDQVIVPRGLWEQIANQLSAVSETEEKFKPPLCCFHHTTCSQNGECCGQDRIR